ncbi:MAG: family 43 glycosylhydrolase, partial [Bacteroidales bacterium]|nr:family 43 glycosylhydrolase [Bacteroidales bacterium]
MIKNISICTCVLLACCCKVEPPSDSDEIDTTLTKRTPTESAAYKTFYKPANGNSGDPMPFYNEDDQTFYDFLLVEPINGAFARNHIFVTKTKDFANFGALSETFPSGSDNEHDQWIGTGSCIKKGNTYYFFYSGMNDAFEASQVVMKATSIDLVNWNKVPSATIEAPAGYDKREFRDPCVYWDDTRNKYVMLVAGRKGSVAVIVRYQSDDLIAWDRIEDITATTSDNPQELEVVTDTRMMECPDIFKIGSVWYLVFSRINADVHRKTFYRVADNPNGPWRISVEDGKHETFDGLFLYAAKTVSDG